MKIKHTLTMNTLQDIQEQKEVILENDDRLKLIECLSVIKELYYAVVKEKAIIPPTETQLWRLLNQTEVINEQHAIILSETEK